MAGVQGSALAIAVSTAGGLGSLPCAMLTPEALRRELTQIRAQDRSPVQRQFLLSLAGVEPDVGPRTHSWAGAAGAGPRSNWAVHPPRTRPGSVNAHPFDVDRRRHPGRIQAASGQLPFRAAFDASLLQRVRATGATILASATTVDEARWLASRGVDAIIAQGAEAGGHRGMFLSDDVTTQIGTLALVPQIVHAVSVPVIAAGGYRGRARRQSRAGARRGGGPGGYRLPALSGNHHGCRPSHRADQRRRPPHGVDQSLQRRPARGIVNRVMRELGPMRSDIPRFPLASAALQPLRAAAEAIGRGLFAAVGR